MFFSMWARYRLKYILINFNHSATFFQSLHLSNFLLTFGPIQTLASYKATLIKKRVHYTLNLRTPCTKPSHTAQTSFTQSTNNVHIHHTIVSPSIFPL